jgi:hypothetical protein
MQHLAGTKSTSTRPFIAKDFQVFRNEGDVIVALDGANLSGTSLSDLLQQLTAAPVGTVIQPTMINKFNSMDDFTEQSKKVGMK